MFHRNSKAADNHVVQRFSVSNTAALLALGPFATDDRGSIAFQEDVEKFFILRDHSPITWYDITGAVVPAVFVELIQFAASDEATAITSGTNKIKIPITKSVDITSLKAYLSTPQTSGSTFTVDLKLNGVSILSTLLTIDNTESSSVTAATPAVVSTAWLTLDSVLSCDVTQVGDGTAKGLKITLGVVPH